jgi:hypothetical protein
MSASPSVAEYAARAMSHFAGGARLTPTEDAAQTLTTHACALFVTHSWLR